ncbi:MAG: molecular chaperone DnaJ [Anaerolineales bacterium]|nr:molecular chaperone DnaJ [Anaerolineales bacterium]
MAEKRDYYEVLGIPRSASADEIRQAYRNLAKKHHPDINKSPDAEEVFKEINEAYAVLSDESRRSSYDRFGHSGVQGMPMDFDFSFSDIFEDFFGFGMGMGSRRSRNAPRRGANLRYDLHLEFEEAVFGLEKELEFERMEACSVCQGSGAEPGTDLKRCETCSGSGEIRQVRQTILGSMVNVSTCPACGGRGEVISSPCKYCNGNGLERVKIHRTIAVPAGVDDGTQIRIPGEGEPGSSGGPRGDMYVVVHVKTHKFFRRKGNDVLLDLGINIAQATLGAEVSVPTLEGEEKMRIPAGTQSGKVLKLRSKGIPYLRRSGRGDQLVIISVEIPRSLKPEQRELFERLAETMGTEAIPQERSFLDSLKDFIGGFVE